MTHRIEKINLKNYLTITFDNFRCWEGKFKLLLRGTRESKKFFIYYRMSDLEFQSLNSCTNFSLLF